MARLKGCAIRGDRANAVHPCQHITFYLSEGIGRIRRQAGPQRAGEEFRTILEKNPVKLEENSSEENPVNLENFFDFICIARAAAPLPAGCGCEPQSSDK